MAAGHPEKQGQVWFPHAAKGAWAHSRALVPTEQPGTSQTREKVNMEEAGGKATAPGAPGTHPWDTGLGQQVNPAQQAG